MLLCAFIVLLTLPAKWATAVDQRDAHMESILNSLKESGVIDQFEKELRSMLKQEKSKQDSAAVDLAQYIREYISENQISMANELVEQLASLPVAEGNVYQHMIRMNALINRIAAIHAFKDPTMDAQASDIVKRMKSMAIMKSSLDRLYDQAQSSRAEPPVTKIDQMPTQALVPDKKDNDADELSDTLLTFLQMIKAKPEQMMGMILPAIEAYELLSKETLGYVDMYCRTLIKSDGFSFLMDTLISWVQRMLHTDVGRRLLGLVPSLMQTKDRDQILDIIQKETEWSWIQFFKSLQNSDLKQDFLDSLSTSVLSVGGVVRDFLYDDMKMALVNTFLLTQGLPAISTKKLLPSLVNLVDKSARFFTTWQIDVKQYEPLIQNQLKQFEREYISLSKFGQLTPEEQKRLVSRFLDDNLADPAQLLWAAHQHVSNAPQGDQCAAVLLCTINAKMGQSGNSIKLTMSRALSLAAAWAWQFNRPLTQSNLSVSLYQAVWDGANSVDCQSQYQPPGKENSRTCDIFPWQQAAMNLDFEHTEL